MFAIPQQAGQFDMADTYRKPRVLEAARGSVVDSCAPVTSAVAGPRKRTLRPYVTGTSVLAIQYDGGVMLAADTLGSYGSLARFKSLSRLRAVGDATAIGGSGDYSDFQYIHQMLDEMVLSDACHADGHDTTPTMVHNYLSRVMYNRRSRQDPLWNTIVVAGRRNGKTFLGTVDLLGTSFEERVIATGYGEHIALPLLRKALDDAGETPMTRDDAKALLERCMRVLFYRDARTINKIQLADVSDEGVSITEPYELETDWAFGEKTSHTDESTW